MGMTTDIAERTLQAAKAKALEMGERVAIGVVDARGDLSENRCKNRFGVPSREALSQKSRLFTQFP